MLVLPEGAFTSWDFTDLPVCIQVSSCLCRFYSFTSVLSIFHTKLVVLIAVVNIRRQFVNSTFFCSDSKANDFSTCVLHDLTKVLHVLDRILKKGTRCPNRELFSRLEFPKNITHSSKDSRHLPLSPSSDFFGNSTRKAIKISWQEKRGRSGLLSLSKCCT